MNRTDCFRCGIRALSFSLALGLATVIAAPASHGQDLKTVLGKIEMAEYQQSQIAASVGELAQVLQSVGNGEMRVMEVGPGLETVAPRKEFEGKLAADVVNGKMTAAAAEKALVGGGPAPGKWTRALEKQLAELRAAQRTLKERLAKLYRERDHLREGSR